MSQDSGGSTIVDVSACSKAVERKVECISNIASILVSRGQTLFSYAYSLTALLVSGVALAISLLGTLHNCAQQVSVPAPQIAPYASLLLVAGLAIFLARYAAPRLLARDIEKLLRIGEVNKLLGRLGKYCEKLDEVLKSCRDLCAQGKLDDKLLCLEVVTLTQPEGGQRSAQDGGGQQHPSACPGST